MSPPRAHNSATQMPEDLTNRGIDIKEDLLIVIVKTNIALSHGICNRPPVLEGTPTPRRRQQANAFRLRRIAAPLGRLLFSITSSFNAHRAHGFGDGTYSP